MLRDPHRDKGIASRTTVDSRLALPLQADLLAILDAGGDRDVEVAPRREAHPCCPAMHAVGESDRGESLNILAAYRCGGATAEPAGAAASGPPAEQVGEDVGGIEAAAAATRRSLH